MEHHVLDSSNRDSDHKKVMLPLELPFQVANAEPHIVIGRARSMLLFRGKPLGNFQPYGYCFSFDQLIESTIFLLFANMVIDLHTVLNEF